MGDRPLAEWTSRVLTTGTLLSAALFAFGFILGLIGNGAAAGDPLRLDDVLGAVMRLEPWGISLLGVAALLVTPAAGLLASALETRRSEPRSALLALAVLGILAVVTAIALLG